MIHGYCSWNIFYDLFKCLRFLKGCLNATLQFPYHLQEHLEKKHTHTTDGFPLKNHGQSFSLNYLFLQFNSRIDRGFQFCEQFLSEEIRGILLCKNQFCKYIYLPKYIFRKNLFLLGNTKILVSYIDVSVIRFSAFCFLNVQALLIKINSKEISSFQSSIHCLGSRKIPPGKIPTRKIPTHQTPPWKIPPRKISTQKIPTWNIPTHFINCLSSLFLHLILPS